MTGVMTVGRRRRWAPGPDAGINWDHPLSAGLAEFWHGGAPTSTLVGGVAPVFVSGPTRVPTVHGDGMYCTGGSGVDLANRGVLLSSSGSTALPMSIHMVVDPITWPANFTTLIERAAAGSGRDFIIQMRSPGSVDWVSIGVNGSGNVLDSSAVDAIGMTAGVTWHFALVYDGVTTATIYLDGVVKATRTQTASGATPTNSVIRIGHAQAQPNANAVFTAVQIWRRALSAAEIGALYEDAFQMLTTPVRRFYSISAGPAVGFDPVLFSRFDSPIYRQ